MESPIAGYVSTYTEITDYIPDSLSQKILSNSSLWQETHPNNDLKCPGFVYDWHVPMDVMYTYSDGEHLCGEFTPFLIRDVKIALWPRISHTLDDLIPRPDPPIVMWVPGEWQPDLIPILFAWIKNEYLVTEEGKVLRSILMKKRLSGPLAP